jgi:hypothetical protein
MPQLFEDRQAPHLTGIICDCCGKRCEANGTDGDFVVKHVCGYDSVFDMGTVSFALCDDCLLRLAVEHIPGAIFEDDSRPPRDVAPRASVIARLKERIAADDSAAAALHPDNSLLARSTSDRTHYLTVGGRCSLEARLNAAPGTYSCHEALHVASLVVNMIDDNLMQHDSILHNPEWFRLAYQAMEATHALYQAIGAVHLLAIPSPPAFSKRDSASLDGAAVQPKRTAANSEIFPDSLRIGIMPWREADDLLLDRVKPGALAPHPDDPQVHHSTFESFAANMTEKALSVLRAVGAKPGITFADLATATDSTVEAIWAILEPHEVFSELVEITSAPALPDFSARLLRSGIVVNIPLAPLRPRILEPADPLVEPRTDTREWLPNTCCSRKVSRYFEPPSGSDGKEEE